MGCKIELIDLGAVHLSPDIKRGSDRIDLASPVIGFKFGLRYE